MSSITIELNNGRDMVGVTKMISTHNGKSYDVYVGGNKHAYHINIEEIIRIILTEK